jgi:hypothetical protein
VIHKIKRSDLEELSTDELAALKRVLTSERRKACIITNGMQGLMKEHETEDRKTRYSILWEYWNNQYERTHCLRKDVVEILYRRNHQ